MAEEAKTPVGAASVSGSGTDKMVASAPAAGMRAKAAEPEKGNAAETASLISEDDLPAWLRAFGENEAKQQAPPATDESWMVGADNDSPLNAAAAQSLAQSWQSPSQQAAARPRTGAASVFAKPDENQARPERVIAATTKPAPVAPEPEVVAKSAETRKDFPRPVPTQRERSGGVPLQRVALVAFIIALVIFLAVVGFFLLGS